MNYWFYTYACRDNSGNLKFDSYVYNGWFTGLIEEGLKDEKYFHDKKLVYWQEISEEDYLKLKAIL